MYIHIHTHKHINIHCNVKSVLKSKYSAADEFSSVPKVYMNAVLSVLDHSGVMMREMIDKLIIICIVILITFV